MAWVSSIAVAPIETLALLHYASNYLPWLMHSVEGESSFDLARIRDGNRPLVDIKCHKYY